MRLLQQFSLFSCLLLQFQCFLYLYVAYNQHVNKQLIAYYAAKRSKIRRRERHIHLRKLMRKKRSRWVNSGRTDLWWQNMINGVSPDGDWKRNFRMSREEFLELCEELRPHISPCINSPNYLTLSLEKKVAVALYYLKDTGSIWMTANTFGIHQCTVSKVILQFCNAVTTHLGPKYLHLPRTVDEMQTTVAEFETKFGMTQAFGCVDGTHVPIRRPIINSQDYFNYKQFYSISAQAICDAKGLFLDVDCRWPGSVHDAKVFSNSLVNNKLKTGHLVKTFNHLLPGYNKIPNYLIGDPAYPLTPNCMKEFQSCKNDAEVIFNNMLRSARNPIECAFGRLKARWSILTRKMDLKLEIIPKVILTCFILHNFCELHNSPIDEDIVKSQISRNMAEETAHQNVPDPVYSSTTGEGETVRDTLVQYIYTNLPDNY